MDVAVVALQIPALDAGSGIVVPSQVGAELAPIAVHVTIVVPETDPVRAELAAVGTQIPPVGTEVAVVPYEVATLVPRRRPIVVANVSAEFDAIAMDVAPVAADLARLRAERERQDERAGHRQLLRNVHLASSCGDLDPCEAFDEGRGPAVYTPTEAALSIEAGYDFTFSTSPTNDPERGMKSAHGADGCALAWTETGAGKPVLLIHGFASTARRNWQETGWMDALGRAGYRVIAYDQRGHGDSEKRYDPEDYGPQRLMEDAVAVLDAAAVERAIIMGYSMGARVALEVALRRPARVRASVLAGMGIEFRDFGGPRYDREIVARALESEDTSGLPRGALFYRRFADQMQADRRALAACWRRPIRELDATDLAAVTLPVLFTVGARDEVAGDPEPLAAAMGNAKVVRLAGKDHMTAVGAKQHREAVLAFFAELGD